MGRTPGRPERGWQRRSTFDRAGAAAARYGHSIKVYDPGEISQDGAGGGRERRLPRGALEAARKRLGVRGNRNHPPSGASREHARAETAQNRSAQEQRSENFLAWLDTEIAAFEELDQLDHAAEAELLAYAFDARLLLPDNELEKIRRYQAHTERQFDSTFKPLMEWRKLQEDLKARRMQALEQLNHDGRR
jgi:hypothetical protein